jgi:hypothetical protein
VAKSLISFVTSSLRHNGMVFRDHVLPLHRGLGRSCADGFFLRRRPNISYVDGLPGPRTVLLGCPAQHVLHRRPQLKAIGVGFGRRHVERFL